MWPFTPGWKSKDRKRAEKAIAKVCEENILLEAVHSAPHGDVRCIALGKLNVDKHQSLFIEIAGDERCRRQVRLTALGLVKDTDAVITILRNQDSDANFRADAVKCIPAQTRLAEWARFEENTLVIESILAGITDKAILIDLAKEPGGILLRWGCRRDQAIRYISIEAIRRLGYTDTAVLRNIAATASYPFTKYTAIVKLPEEIQACEEMQHALLDFVFDANLSRDVEIYDAIKLLVDRGKLQAIIDKNPNKYIHPYPEKRLFENELSNAAMRRMDELGYEVIVQGQVFL